MLDRTLQAAVHAEHKSRILRYGHWSRNTLFVAMVPLWALVVLHVVHDLAECGTIVEVNLYRFALLIVVDERFAMLADV